MDGVSLPVAVAGGGDGVGIVLRGFGGSATC